MAERYEQAAWRHYRTGEALMASGHIDDAGYHFGMAGENAVKNALRESGLERVWLDSAAAAQIPVDEYLKSTPMRGHLPELRKLVKKAQVEISLHAVGRIAGNINALMLDPSFVQRFHKWNLNIRYADSDHCPVRTQDCESWQTDAEEMILGLVI